MAQKLGVDEKLPSLDMLPDLPLLKVFSYLDLKDLCRVRRVCSRWYHVTRSPTLWRYIPASNASPKDIEKVLPVMPQSIRSLRLSGKKNQQQEFPLNDFLLAIEKFAPNMEELVLENFERISGSLMPDFCGPIYEAVILSPGHVALIPDFSALAPRHLHVSSNIRVLNFSSCQYVTNRTLFCLRCLVNLEEIYLPNCPVTDMSVVPFLKVRKNLRVIDLEATPIGKATFEALGEYGNALQELYIADTLTTDKDLKRILAGDNVLPNLKVLCLKHTKVTLSCVKKHLKGSGKKMQVTVSKTSVRRKRIADDFPLYIKNVKHCDHHKRKRKSLVGTCHIDLI